MIHEEYILVITRGSMKAGGTAEAGAEGLEEGPGVVCTFAGRTGAQARALAVAVAGKCRGVWAQLGLERAG